MSSSQTLETTDIKVVKGIAISKAYQALRGKPIPEEEKPKSKMEETDLLHELMQEFNAEHGPRAARKKLSLIRKETARKVNTLPSDARDPVCKALAEDREVILDEAQEMSWSVRASLRYNDTAARVRNGRWPQKFADHLESTRVSQSV